jgi:hypothetical protein
MQKSEATGIPNFFAAHPLPPDLAHVVWPPILCKPGGDGMQISSWWTQARPIGRVSVIQLATFTMLPYHIPCTHGMQLQRARWKPAWASTGAAAPLGAATGAILPAGAWAGAGALAGIGALIRMQPCPSRHIPPDLN